jgi:LacI family transcriptional regulator
LTSLRSLAADLRLSITTVSRALDGYGDVAPGTRERVRKAAQAAGYRPNAAARRLRKGSSETVALVVPADPGRFFEPAFTDLLALIGARLAERHFDLMLLAARPGPDEIAAYSRIVKDRRADACIVIRTRRDDARVRFLQETGLPFICHGRTGSDRPYEFIDGDGEAGFRDVTLRLIAGGHRRIAHIAAPEAYNFAGLRKAGWQSAMREAGLRDDLAFHCEATETAGETVAARLLALPDRPTAIVCSTDRIAIGAIQAAWTAGLEPGRDLAITGHDNIHAARFTHPSLTTMTFDTAAVAERMVQRLFALMNGETPGGGQIFPLQHFVRASSGEATASLD